MLVTVMADYGAFPLWSGTGSFMIGADSIELPEDVRADLAEWGAFYDETLSSNGYEWPSDEVEMQFVDRGRELARRVAVALGGEFEVLYFNDATSERETIPAD
jgi:hypothetical protein